MVGLSGCGKSMLLWIVVGLDLDFCGSVMFDGSVLVGLFVCVGVIF